jgi:hypothetical protein
MKSTKKINKIMGFLKFALPFIIVFPLIVNAQEADEELVVSGSFLIGSVIRVRKDPCVS